MKKMFRVFVAVAFALSLATVALAEMKAEPAKPAEPAKAAEPMKKAGPAKKAPKAHQLTGTVEAVDAVAGTITVKGKKTSVSLKAGDKVELEKFNVGDKVLVKYTGDTASSVKHVTAKKGTGKKKTMKKEAPAKSEEPMKKEMAPAPPAAPTGK